MHIKQERTLSCSQIEHATLAQDNVVVKKVVELNIGASKSIKHFDVLVAHIRPYRLSRG